MSKLIGFTDDAFCHGGSILPNHAHPGLFYSLKRVRPDSPFVRSRQEERVSIDDLPDECLFEVLRRVPSPEARSICAGVSRRWLCILISILQHEYSTKALSKHVTPETEHGDDGGGGCLSRSVDGRRATDIRLAAIAIGTASRGGLGKLSVHGVGGSVGVSDTGLKAIGRGCPSLESLSLWNLARVGDAGLIEIANGCRLLEKLDLVQCAAITDAGLIAVANKCPNLKELRLESCPAIGDASLQAIGQHCMNLKSVSIKGCPLVGDQGVGGLIMSACRVMEKLELHSLSITDLSLAVLGYYGDSIVDVLLDDLPKVSERGFWVMGSCPGLQNLKSLTVRSCLGFTDAGLEATAKGCPKLKLLSLKRCPLVSDNGLVALTRAFSPLETLSLEECHRITGTGFFYSLCSTGLKLKSVSLTKCLGVKEISAQIPTPSSSPLRSLSVRQCPSFGVGCLALLAKLRPSLQNLELTELPSVTDSGLLPLLSACKCALMKVNLSGCAHLSDTVVQELTKLHGWTLESLNLDGCPKITDTGVSAIADGCLLLHDLNLSRCAVTDSGIAALAASNHLSLQLLSIAGCSMITDKSLPSLIKLGKSLLGLNLQRCISISSKAVSLLVDRLWRCDILS